MLFVWGVEDLFDAEKHDLIVPLVNALGKRTFKSDRLKDVAIQMAFHEGAKRGKTNTLWNCITSIMRSPLRNMLGDCIGLGTMANQIKSFGFLLEQADQGDLDKANEEYAGEHHEKFRQAIDKAPGSTPPAGSRHSRFSEKTEDVEETSTDTVPLVTFPEPVQVAFDDKGVPILNGMDPTKVPFAGLSILERVERAKMMREERQKKEAETGSSTD